MNRQAFFASLRRRKSGVFGTSLTQKQVDGCEVILDRALHLPITFTAYILATTYHETAHTMQPVRETLAKTDAQAMARLESYYRKRGSKGPVYWRDGFFGRGFVQLTWRDNYARAGAETGYDLVAHPELAMRPDVAAEILVTGCLEGWFTGKCLGDCLPGDYEGARRVVNGTDRAALIAAYAHAFEAALIEAGYEAAPKPAPTTEPEAPPAPPATEIPALTVWAGIIQAISSIFGGRK